MGSCPFICGKKKPAPPQTPVAQPPIIVLNTEISLIDIKRISTTPPQSKTEIFKFNCPICLCYFSNILISQCCEHYICHFCVLDLEKKAADLNVSCPICRSSPFCVADVNIESQPKDFSDSFHKVMPFATAKIIQDPNDHLIMFNKTH